MILLNQILSRQPNNSEMLRIMDISKLHLNMDCFALDHGEDSARISVLQKSI